MPGADDDSHLSRISTRWDDLLQAHHGQSQEAARAQLLILRRYCGAIYRYLLSLVRDPDIAEELSQEFALRFMRGQFKTARPDRGRFRDFLKKSLWNLVTDYRRSQRSRPLSLQADQVQTSAQEFPDESDAQFLKHWRDELLGRVWESLAAEEAESGRLYHTVLSWRVKHASQPMTVLAGELNARLEKSMSESSVRVMLHRARERFADLLLDEVARSLQTADQSRIEQELIDLDLLSYCRQALDRRNRKLVRSIPISHF